MSPIFRNVGPAPRTISEARMGAEYGTAYERYRAPLLARVLRFFYWGCK